MDRRRFLGCSAVLALSTAGSGLLAGCAALPMMTVPLEGDRIGLSTGELEALLAEAPGVYLTAPELGHGVMLLRDGDGLIALSATCTHLDCRVRPEGDRIFCPCHGSTFARDGAVLRGPARRALDTFPIALTADRVEIVLTPTPV